MGKRIRMSWTVRACFSASQLQNKRETSHGAASTPRRTIPPATRVRIPRAAPAKRPASFSFP